MSLKKITLLRENIPSFDRYPFSIPSIKNLREINLESNVTFFVGENGSGKSTLLEAIADKCDFNTAGGGRNNTYDVYASEAVLGKYIRLSWLPKITNGFFLRRSPFTTLPPILMRSMIQDLKITVVDRFTNSLMENPFCHYFYTALGGKQFIFWMNQRQRYHQQDS